uniref:UDP-N-acetylglucosamine--peptide N-acetylglucosaminyltransferase SPINDLY n=1 Tax=Castor canadensis TaxID=51338 RepID=A0A8C0WG14_CASCN
MSKVPKHFGLKPKEESYMFQELEKVRQETRKDFLRFKQKWASKPTLDESSDHGPEDPGPTRHEEKAGRLRPKGTPPARGPATSAAARLQKALRGPAAAPEKTRSFRPQDFYMTSSAFLRQGPPKKPPVIAPGVGTARPVVLLPPPVPPVKPRARRDPGSARPAAPRRVLHVAGGHQASQDPPPASEGLRPKDRKTSSISSGDGDVDPSSQQQATRIRTHFVRQGSGEARASVPKAVREGGRPSESRESERRSPQPARAMPKSIEEIIASLQSEAQLAFDQTIKELIQSVLGQNYDIKMEDISLMGEMYLKTPQEQAETPEKEAEQGLQKTVEEPQTSMAELLPEETSSVFQIVQEDVLEWEAVEGESTVFKPQETEEIQPAEESSKPSEDGHPESDLKAPKRVSLKVISSEFLQIQGKEFKRRQKSKPVVFPLRRRKSLKPRCDQKPTEKIPQVYLTPNIHDLCTTMPAQELPLDLCLASRVYHTPDKKSHNNLLGIFRQSLFSDHFIDTEEQRARILYGIPVMSEKQECGNVPPTSPANSLELARRTSCHAYTPPLNLLGQEMSAHPGFTKLLWSPTAPKFAAPESVMREMLYPKYEYIEQCLCLMCIFHLIISQSFILKKSASFENIQKHFRTQFPKLKRASSAVELRKEECIAPLQIRDDMQSNMEVLSFQKEMARKCQFSKPERTSEVFVKEHINDIFDSLQEKHSLKHPSLSLTEASKKAGLSYIIYPKKKKMKWKKGLKSSKLERVYEELSKPPRIIKRSMSHGILPGQKKYFIKVPVYERQIRCPSAPAYLSFDEFVQSKGGTPANSDPWTWAISFINAKRQKPPKQTVETSVSKELPEKVSESTKLELNDYVTCGLPPEVIRYYEAQVEILTEEINNKETFPVFAYCRRGAIYRKLGKLQSAMNDLQKAIFLEPLFLNAFWHRHFIYLFQDRINDALDDLNYINKYNKNNAEAYLSRAEIFREKNNITLAILNYTQAIKCMPTNADVYFKRGEMYEKANKVLAVDDYSKCIFYDPQRTDALMKRGIFYYENESWTAAIQDFTALLNIDRLNSQARTYRGRAYFKKQLFKKAIEDFAAAIHLDPNNWLALYYRACLFRKTNPYRALQDYSVSALINDGYENFSCFLHRGILYTHLKLWLLAICDFETVISLERTVILAHINIGLIYLLHLDNYTEAIWHFSEAIKIDPLYIQSYICKAESYHKLHKLKRAVSELSRAIHLHPDEIELYIIRGQYLLMMRCFDLAKFTIYQISEMNKGLIELSPVQQALIYSFCEKHDKAIQVLDGIMLNKPEIIMYAVLAKAQMKAKKIKEAVRMFKKALEAFPQSEAPNDLAISGDCLYNLGLCYMKEGNIQMACDSFTKAVKANPDLAEGFYHRGLCKVKLHKDSAILDFNRTITLNPKHYQAYLCRVAFYGLKGRYSKAILNCNEAIKIYPESVRAYLYRGALKYHNKSYKLAITDLTTAVNMDKNNYIAFYNRALCYTKIGDFQKALIDYGIVLLIGAEETLTLNTYINRGLIYTELQQYTFALEDFKQAAVISQTNVSLCQATAMCHHRIKEFEKAVTFFTWAIKINPRFLDAYIGRGNSYMEYGHDDAIKQAQKDFLKVLHLNPAYIKARISLCYNLQALGKFQKAWLHFTIAINVDRKSYLAYEGRAVVCLQMGDYLAAMQDINAAIKINTSAEFLTNRGVIHEFMGHPQNAMKDYQTAISLDPKYSLAYFNAGNIYFRHRQFSQAGDYFSKALKFNSENEYALMNQAVTNTILEKYEEAKEDFSRVIERCPFWAAVYFNRAHFYCCLKQYKLADEDLIKALTLKPNDAVVYSLRAKVRGKMGLIEEAIADYNQALGLEEFIPVT